MERDIKKIKVLQVVGGMDRAGAETFVMNLFRNINKDKYDFNFLYFTDKKCDYDDEILSLNGKIHRIKLINFFSNIINLIRFFKKERFYRLWLGNTVPTAFFQGTHWLHHPTSTKTMLGLFQQKQCCSFFH